MKITLSVNEYHKIILHFFSHCYVFKYLKILIKCRQKLPIADRFIKIYQHFSEFVKSYALLQMKYDLHYFVLSTYYFFNHHVYR